MSRWTAEEIRELVTLWPTSTAAQIAYRLRRSRAAICGKAKRLLEEGLLEGKNANNPNPRKRRRRARPLRIWIMPPPPPPPANDSLAMRPCSLLQLDEARCHWPLGDVNEVATEFCGGAPAPGHRYCRHHMRMAHGQGSDAGHATRY
jgi:GcrA cell cycle regulator